MKHNTKITILLILMFLVTQLIGLFVISVYQNPKNTLPFNMAPPQDVTPTEAFPSIIFAFVIAIALFFLLIKLKAEKFIRLWFFIVTSLALGLTLKVFFIFRNSDIIINNSVPILTSILPEFSLFSLIAIAIALPLAYIKIFKRDMIVHNLTELLIYPGIAAVFIPLLNVLGIIILLLLISIYDIWAVWHSEVMQKMAKYQINTLKFFTGFFIPYASKKDKLKIREIKDKYSDKNEKFLESKIKKAKIKVSLAILGGGDVIFPIITAGVFLKIYMSLAAALIISITATLALLALFIFAQKKKFYPAMPFLTIGMYIGMIIDWILIMMHVI